MSMEWILAIGVAIAGLVVSIITLGNVVALRRSLRGSANRSVDAAPPEPCAGAVETGNVFCRECGSIYDSVHTACPSCHTPRG